MIQARILESIWRIGDIGRRWRGGWGGADEVEVVSGRVGRARDEREGRSEGEGLVCG